MLSVSGAVNEVQPHRGSKEHPNTPSHSFSSQGFHRLAEALLEDTARFRLGGSFFCIKVEEMCSPSQLVVAKLKHLPKATLGARPRPGT